MKRTRVAVLFGGRSVEHEISIITGLQLIRAIDVVAFEPIPVYISASGRWYAGPELLETNFYRNMPCSLDRVSEVTLLPIPNLGGLTVLKQAQIPILGAPVSSRLLQAAGGDARAPRKGLAVPRLYTTSDLSPGEILPIDVFFPTFHGSYGEDGCIQGLFEMAAVTYTGSRVLASALSMSKQHCKEIVSYNGVPVLPSLVVAKDELQKDLGKGLLEVRQRIVTTSGFTTFPLFIKPCNLGSSIGVARAQDISELDAALVQACKYDTALIVEPCLDQKLEINVAVLGGDGLTASVTEIPVPSAGKELTYEDKYMRGGAKKTTGAEAQGMAGLTRVIDPPDLSPQTKDLAQNYAKKAFQALGCAGVARVDFMLDLAGDKLYFNEINPLPGSLAFYLWAGSRPPILYTDLLTRIIERAQREQDERLNLNRDVGFKAMFKSN